MATDFTGFDTDIERALVGNKRFLEDLFMADAGAMKAMLDESVEHGWRTPDEAATEYADFLENAKDVGRTAVQTSPNFYL